MAGLFRTLGSVGNSVVTAAETLQSTLEAGRIASKGLLAISADFTASTEKSLEEKATKGGYVDRYKELLDESKVRLS